MTTDPRIEAFFAEPGPWRPELAALRTILTGAGLAEEYKWRGPCYTGGGGNICTLWRLKDGAGIGFFKGVLLPDPEGLLTAPGENSRSMRTARFTSLDAVAAAQPALRALVDAAIEAEEAGRTVDFPKDDLPYPDELADRLDTDPAFREAFEALTPGRRRGYVLTFAQPKKSETRIARIDKHAPRILAGKGLHDR